MNKLDKQTAILHRQLATKTSNETVDVFIGKPIMQEHEEWLCSYRIVGAGLDMNYKIVGFDGVQAVQLAFKMIENMVENCGVELTWLGENNLDFVPK